MGKLAINEYVSLVGKIVENTTQGRDDEYYLVVVTDVEGNEYDVEMCISDLKPFIRLGDKVSCEDGKTGVVLGIHGMELAWVELKDDFDQSSYITCKLKDLTRIL